LKAGEIEFPTIPVTYFDVNKEQYVTLTTTPITVSISESERIGASEIAMAATSLRQEASLESHQDGILANDDDYAALRNESPRPGFWLAYISLLGTVYLGIVLTSRHLARYWSDSASVRRRGAARVARDRLKQALLKIEQVGWRGGAEGVRGAFCGLVADYANQAEAGMTPRDATSNLRKLGVPEPLLQRLQQVLDACDDARYGGTSNVMPPKDTLDRLLEDLIAAVKQSKQ